MTPNTPGPCPLLLFLPPGPEPARVTCQWNSKHSLQKPLVTASPKDSPTGPSLRCQAPDLMHLFLCHRQVRLPGCLILLHHPSRLHLLLLPHTLPHIFPGLWVVLVMVVGFLHLCCHLNFQCLSDLRRLWRVPFTLCPTLWKSLQTFWPASCWLLRSHSHPDPRPLFPKQDPRQPTLHRP